MKQPKKLTREQKECLSAHYLNCKDWMLVEETEFYYRIINKNTGVIKSVDKFRRVRRRKNHELDEWVKFCKWIEALPYSDIIIGRMWR